MDLFEAYPELRTQEHDDIQGKSLRLIGLSALASDTSHYYFEFSKPKMWGTSNGIKVVGVGPARVLPTSQRPLYAALITYIRRHWRCDGEIAPTSDVLVMNTEHELSHIQVEEGNFPFLVMLTAPRLGGSVMPDALAQVVYHLEITRSRSTHRTNLLRVQREHLTDFLDHDVWELRALKEAGWAEVRLHEPLPDNSKARPVLGLRALKPILDAGLYHV